MIQHAIAGHATHRVSAHDHVVQGHVATVQAWTVVAPVLLLVDFLVEDCATVQAVVVAIGAVLFVIDVSTSLMVPRFASPPPSASQ